MTKTAGSELKAVFGSYFSREKGSERAANVGAEMHIGEGDGLGGGVGVGDGFLQGAAQGGDAQHPPAAGDGLAVLLDRKSTRLNSSHIH